MQDHMTRALTQHQMYQTTWNQSRIQFLCVSDAPARSLGRCRQFCLCKSTNFPSTNQMPDPKPIRCMRSTPAGKFTCFMYNQGNSGAVVATTGTITQPDLLHNDGKVNINIDGVLGLTCEDARGDGTFKCQMAMGESGSKSKQVDATWNRGAADQIIVNSVPLDIAWVTSMGTVPTAQNLLNRDVDVWAQTWCPDCAGL